jgi:hypothetical protein
MRGTCDPRSVMHIHPREERVAWVKDRDGNHGLVQLWPAAADRLDRCELTDS